ncbi:MAG: hypothetical protein E4H39_02405 [Syntrophobacterales bacterium]|nr:MAG: hypothetical protein E4H39_02405 [Syntrophobacterales bacterium]
MDKQFINFWVDFLTNYMKTQEQMEDMSAWMEQGFKGFDELTELFQKSYGLDRLSESTANHLTMWEQSTKDFERSLTEYLSLMGVVPKQEHLELVEKYEALKEKSASQEETIVHLRQLIEGKQLDQKELHTGFETLIKKQSDDFNRLVETMGDIGAKEEPVKQKPSPGKKKATKTKVTKKASAK